MADTGSAGIPGAKNGGRKGTSTSPTGNAASMISGLSMAFSNLNSRFINEDQTLFKKGDLVCIRKSWVPSDS